MNTVSQDTQKADLWERSGLGCLLRSFKMAVHPPKLLLAFAGLVLTILWGVALDRVWIATDHGLSPAKVATQLGILIPSAPDQDKQVGPFAVIRQLTTNCILDGIYSVRHGRIIGSPGLAAAPAGLMSPGSPEQRLAQALAPMMGADGLPGRGALADVVLIGRGTVWLFRQHLFFAIPFGLACLIAWGLVGGAVCRMTTMQFARDEVITVAESLRFSWEKLWNGFFMAPFVPLLMCAGVGLLMMIGGLFLRIPWLGDLVGGVAFFLAVIGGFVIALVVTGTIAGGGLFWPTIAAEGSDAFDAISRSFSYVYGRPLRCLWYALVMLVYGSLCFLVLKFFFWLALSSAHLFVGWGTGGKLDQLWAPPTLNAFSVKPADAPTGGGAAVASFLIRGWALALTGVLWSFLASFFLSGSTIVYFLLRRDVDNTEFDDVYSEEPDEEPETAAAPNPPADKPEKKDKPAPAASAPPEPKPSPPAAPEPTSVATETEAPSGDPADTPSDNANDQEAADASDEDTENETTQSDDKNTGDRDHNDDDESDADKT